MSIPSLNLFKLQSNSGLPPPKLTTDKAILYTDRSEFDRERISPFIHAGALGDFSYVGRGVIFPDYSISTTSGAFRLFVN